MPNGIVTREDFDRIKIITDDGKVNYENLEVKLGIIFETEMENQKMLKRKHLDLKAFSGGILGGAATVAAKMAIWR